jgi:hypothetical protein
MLLTRNWFLLLSALWFAAMLTVVGLRQRSDVRAAEPEEPFARRLARRDRNRQRGAWLVQADSKPQRVGVWRRRTIPGTDALRVQTMMSVDVSDSLLGQVRGHLPYLPRMLGMQNLFTSNELFMASEQWVDRDRGVVRLRTSWNMLGQKQQSLWIRDGDLLVMQSEDDEQKSVPASAADREIGFEDRPAYTPVPGDTWTVLILDTKERKPASVQVTVKGTEQITIGGEEVTAHRVQGEEPYQTVVAWYDDDGHVLRERGIIHPLTMLVLDREPYNGADSDWDALMGGEDADQ